MRSRGRLLRRILDRMDIVRLSRKLATIRCDVPLPIHPESLRYRRGQRESLIPLCEELGFTGLIEDIPMSLQRPLFQEERVES